MFNQRPSWKRLRRLALSAAISGTMTTLTWFGPLTTSIAADDLPSTRGGISILIHRFDATADPGRLDRAALPASTARPARTGVPASTARPARTARPDRAAFTPAPSLRRTSSQFDQMIAATLTSSAARWGIPLQGVLEPLAMLGDPTADAFSIFQRKTQKQSIAPKSSTASVIASAKLDAKLNRWWLRGTEEIQAGLASLAPAQTQTQTIDIDIDQAIRELAAEEPLDVQRSPVIGVPAVAGRAPAAKTIAAAATAPAAPLVGSGPIIVTIAESYAPYDMTARDWQLRMTPITTVVPMFSPVYEDAGRLDVATLELPAEPVQDAFAGSPECRLDELIWFVQTEPIVQAVHQTVRHWLPEIDFAAMSVPVAIAVPVADPLPNATPEELRIALAQIETTGEPVGTRLLPTPDPLPDAKLDLAQTVQTIRTWATKIAVVGRSLVQPTPQPTTQPTTQPVQRIAAVETDDSSNPR